MGMRRVVFLEKLLVKRELLPQCVAFIVVYAWMLTSGAKFRESLSQFQTDSKNLSCRFPNFVQDLSYPKLFPIFNIEIAYPGKLWLHLYCMV